MLAAMPTRRPALIALLLCGACASSPTPGTAAVERPAVTVAQALPAGSVLRPDPAELTTAGRAPLLAIDGWLREALRQSRHFDLAAGPDDVTALPERSLWRVQIGCDPTARVLTATLLPPDAAAVPLGSASFAGQSLPAAVDQLAFGVRLALGDPVAEPPLPVALAYSPDASAVTRTENGLRSLQEGRLRDALGELLAARRLDGGNPIALDALAALRALLGETADAEAIAREGLALEQRLTAPTQHRLARSLLLARATQQPAAAAVRDAELLALGRAGQRERPHDPQCRLTEACALSFQGDFAAALPLWRDVARRLPGSAVALYHLGWAELAAGRPAAAAEALLRCTGRLPRGATTLPLLLARYEQGDHDGLRRLFAELQADPDVADGTAGFELQRMRAAHAILTDRPDEATRLLLDSLEWLRRRPSLLAERAREVAATAEVLVRLGQAEATGLRLQALQDLRLPSAPLQDALAFGQGLVEVARTGRRALAAEQGLLRDGRLDAWGFALQAFGHRKAGELQAEHEALAQATRLDDGPLQKAALVRSLQAMGRDRDAGLLQAALRREMAVIHLRQRLQHPLLAPELALASRTLPSP